MSSAPPLIGKLSDHFGQKGGREFVRILPLVAFRKGQADQFPTESFGGEKNRVRVRIQRGESVNRTLVGRRGPLAEEVTSSNYLLDVVTRQNAN